ncbi:MAG: peptidoglycan-binding protein [Acidimicrobiia bacterium]
MLVAVVATSFGAAALGLAIMSKGSAVAGEATPPKASLETATVTRNDLVDEDKTSGALGYGDAMPIDAIGMGAITGLPTEGTVLNRGDSLWQVDGHAGPALMYGSLPLWRPLRSGVTAGADVAQLEQNLADLGFGDGVTIDEKFDSTTTAAIKKWQASRGLSKTGVVDQADVFVAPGPVRVGELVARVGSKLGGVIMNVTGTSHVVLLPMSSQKAAKLRVGDSVSVELPDETRLDASVLSIGKVARSGENGGAATIDVTIGLDQPFEGLDASPVKVVVTTSKATGVLTVPIRALLALAEGGFAVEKVTGTSTTLLPVKPGAYGDGIVAITGSGLAEGDKVVVAP